MAEITKHDPKNQQGHGHSAENTEHAGGQVSFEREDINIVQITAFGIGLFVACIVVVFAMWAMFHFLSGQADQRDAVVSSPMLKQRAELPPEPRLTGLRPKAQGPVSPQVEIRQLRDDEDAILNNFGWLDPSKGVVRIPIDLAIDMVAAKGLPSKPSPSGSDNAGFRMIPSDASSGRTLEKISQ